LDLTHLSDDELIAASQKGNRAAFGTLVRRYESVVASTVIGMLGQCDEADDVGQETFLRLYQSLHRFRGDSTLRTYVTRIAINLSLNELKRRNRRRLFTPRLETEMMESAAAAENDSGIFDTHDAIHKALGMLKPKLQAVVTLRLIDGYSTEETAEILHLPIGTVLSRLALAQEKLHSLLSHHKEDA
jgi:RNA polymerase sigma-70 factor (ECF subfamily)